MPGRGGGVSCPGVCVSCPGGCVRSGGVPGPGGGGVPGRGGVVSQHALRQSPPPCEQNE